MESVFENATLDALAQFFPPSFVSTMLDGFEKAVNDNYGKYVACVVVPFSMTQVITYVYMIALWHMTQTCMLITPYIAVCTIIGNTTDTVPISCHTQLGAVPSSFLLNTR